MNKIKTLLTRKNLLNALFFAVCIAIILIPGVKVLFIRAMMYVGLMKAPTESTEPQKNRVQAELMLKSETDSLITMQQLKGKVVILNFWATWCPPCRAEMPSLNALYKHYANDPRVVILPVDVDGDLAKSQSFMQGNQYNLPVYKLAGNLPQQLGFESIPTTYILDSKSRIAAQHSGAASYDDESFYSFIDGLAKAAR